MTIYHMDKLSTFVTGYQIAGLISGTRPQTAQDRQCTGNLILRRVRVTILTVRKH
jgi:hypothetical protein